MSRFILSQSLTKYEIVDTTSFFCHGDSWLSFSTRHAAESFLEPLVDDFENRMTLQRLLNSSLGSEAFGLSTRDNLKRIAEYLIDGRFRIRKYNEIDAQWETSFGYPLGVWREMIEEPEIQTEAAEEESAAEAWIEIVLTGTAGYAIAGEPYTITLPDGSTRKGKTDGQGLVRYVGLEDGSCEFAFSRLDEDAWGPVGSEPPETAGSSSGSYHRYRSGDCIASIAYLYGFFWKKVWQHEKNDELRELRANPNVLGPDDRIFIPNPATKTVSLDCEQRHEYELYGVPTKIKIQLMEFGRPVADKEVSLELDSGVVEQCSSDGSGFVEIPAMPSDKWVLVRYAGRFGPKVYKFQLGQIDPVSDLAGVGQRLRVLGMFPAETDDFDEALRLGLVQFCKVHDLDYQGEIDEEIISKLEEVCGF